MNRYLLKFTLILFVAVGCSFFLYSCKDEEPTITPEPTPNPTTYEIISAHDWSYYEKTRDGVIDTFQRACDFDQIYRYGLDSSYNVIEAGELCSNSLKWSTRYTISETGDSLFQGTSKQLAYQQNTHYKILKLSDTDLKLELTLSGIVWTWSFRK